MQNQAKLEWNCFRFLNIFIILFLCFKSNDKKLSPSWPHSSVRYNPPWPKHPLHVDSGRDWCHFSNGSQSQGTAIPKCAWLQFASRARITMVQPTCGNDSRLPESHSLHIKGRSLHPEAVQQQPWAQPHLHRVKPNCPF